MRKIALLVAIFFLFDSYSPIYAARSLIIESNKQTFTNDEEGEVKVTLSGFTDGETIFVKGAFAKPNSTNYFGFTKKGDAWVKNSVTAADQLSVKIGEWNGKLTIKPDLSDTGFAGSGDYNFKTGFYYYTSGGNLSSVNWSDTKSVNITFVPSPTPTPSITPVPTSTPNPTSVPTSVPTNVSTPTLIPKPQVTATKYVSPTVKITSVPTTAEDGLVLGEISQVSITPMKEKIVGVSSKSPLPVFLALFGGGLLFIAAAAVISMKQIRRTRHL